MEGFADFDLIENLIWLECIKRKGRVSVLIDQFQYGYGCNSIEAWSMSQATVGNAVPEILRLFDEHIGYVPFVCCPCEAHAIRDTVERLRNDADHYREAVARGRQCWHDFHSPDAVAKRALTYYNQAMLRGPAILGQAGLNKAQSSKQKPEARQTLEVGEVGLVKVEYIGPNKVDMAWFGNATGQRYDLGGIRRCGYVYAEDVPGILAATDKVGQPAFRVVK